MSCSHHWSHCKLLLSVSQSAKWSQCLLPTRRSQQDALLFCHVQSHAFELHALPAGQCSRPLSCGHLDLRHGRACRATRFACASCSPSCALLPFSVDAPSTSVDEESSPLALVVLAAAKTLVSLVLFRAAVDSALGVRDESARIHVCPPRRRARSREEIRGENAPLQLS